MVPAYGGPAFYGYENSDCRSQENLTRLGVTYRKPYPALLKAAIAGGHLFNKNDRHFSAEGHALFAKFLTDTEAAQDSVGYYKHPH